jgi:hypothetical protein
MLQQVPRWSPQGVRASVVLAALVAGLLPIRLATAHTGGDPSPADTQPATTPAPAAPAAAPTSPSHAVAAQPSTPSTPSTSPQLPTPPARPSTPVEPLRGRHAARESWYFIDADGSTHGSGDWHDIERARRARAPGSGPAFVFTSRGTAFIVEDAKTVEQVRAILEPQTELGRQQGELGARQGALGQEQGKLGAEQGALGVRQAEISVRQAALAARIASANADILAVAANRMRGQSADTEALRRAEADAKAKLDEVDRQMRDLGEKQAALGEQQGQLGAKQAELGDRQAILGTEQARLGHLQRVAAEKAEGELRAVAERAIAAGLARPVK